jgi:hypothetical protein
MSSFSADRIGLVLFSLAKSNPEGGHWTAASLAALSLAPELAPKRVLPTASAPPQSCHLSLPSQQHGRQPPTYVRNIVALCYYLVGLRQAMQLFARRALLADTHMQ